jgi:hypothetical protein
MVKNYFYLIVGFLCVLFAVTHTLNGMSTTLPILGNAGMEVNTKTAFTYVWHVIGIENLVLGVALLIMACMKNLSKVRFTAWLIITILFMRWVVIASVTLLSNSASVMQLLPDTIAIFVVIVLLFFGTKIKDRISNK